ncbi:methyltransferase [Candidatus Woesearchaeota archaeon]|nr:methyltransferase [Candidatus Woesearchaeota archaeon]
MFKTISEGNVKINVPIERKISKKLSVFYNPVMKFNRDLSVLLLNTVNKKNIQIALPLAGTGVRGVRFLKEVKGIKHVYMNDNNEKAVKLIKQNLKLNKTSKATVSNADANKFLLDGFGFDYIDIDPFGSPNPFLESSIIRLSRKGILAVTATDTSALSGSFPLACMRKYWAKPLRNEQMHETGLRILIRKVQLIGAQFDKALTPIFSYSKDHYMRVFFLCEKGKTHCDKIIKQHNFVVFENDYAGPLWIGQLWDKKLAAKMFNNNKIIENSSFLKIINDESKINTLGFFDLHRISKRYKIHNMQKKEEVTKKLKKKGFKVSNTHFSGTGIRTNASIEDIVKVLK